MDKPCKSCSKADHSMEGYYKCAAPCNRAKQCHEDDRKAMEIFRNYLQKRAEEEYERGGDGDESGTEDD